MSDPSSNPFAIWQEEHSLFRVEYKQSVFEELRAESVRGLHGIGKGGVEVGGVLFGTRLGAVTRILAWKPIASEHAEGPQFALSAKDQEGMQSMLDAARTDPQLRDMQVVGWFVSHVRGEASVTAAESVVHRKFFTESWQWLVVVQPSRFGDAEFTFCIPEAGEPGKLSRLVPVLQVSAAPLLAAIAKEKVNKPAPTMLEHMPVRVVKQRQTGAWFTWTLLHLVLLSGTGYLALRTFQPQFGLHSLFPTPPLEPVRLLSLHAQATTNPKALQVRWNAAADRVRRADRGVIAVRTRQGESTTDISSTTVKDGSYVSPVASGPVQVTLRLFAASEEIATEVTRVRIP